MRRLAFLVFSSFLFSFHASAQELIPYCKDGKYGYCDLKGTLVLPIVYDYAGLFRDKRALVMENAQYYLIDAKGTKINAKPYRQLKGTDWPGLYEAMLGDNLGIIDGDNKVVVPIRYEELYYNEGTVQATLFNKKEILYAPDGRQLLLSDTLISVEEEDSLYTVLYRTGSKDVSSVFSTSGKKLFGPIAGMLSITTIDIPGLYIVTLKDAESEEVEKCGLMNGAGEWLIRLQPAVDKLDWVSSNKRFKEEDTVETVALRRYKDPKAYQDMLDQCYAIFYNTLSSIHIMTLSGKELISEQVGPKGTIIKAKNGLIKTNLYPSEEHGEIKFSNDDFFALDFQDTLDGPLYTWLFDKSGNQLNKKAFTGYRLPNGFPDLVIYDIDSLSGIMLKNGREYIACKYTSLLIDNDSILQLTRADRKYTAIRYPQPESVCSGCWYDYATIAKYPKEMIASVTKGAEKFYAVLDTNYKQLYPATLHNCVIVNDVAVGTEIIEGKKITFIIDELGTKTPLRDGERLIASVSGPKKQFIFLTDKAILYRSGDKEKTLLTYNSREQEISTASGGVKNGVYYLELARRWISTNANEIGVFKIVEEEAEQILPFAATGHNAASFLTLSLLTKDSLCNLMWPDGTEKVPYGPWNRIEEKIFAKNKKGNEYFRPFYIANGDKRSAVYNTREEKVLECKECTITAESQFLNSHTLCLIVSDNKGRKQECFHLYSDVSQRTVPIAFINQGYEDLSDTSVLLRDTIGAAYIYFTTQQQLVKMPFAYKSYTNIEFSGYPYYSVFYFEDTKGHHHFYDTKNGEFRQMPGYMNDFYPVAETFRVSRHQYFYFYSDSTLSKKGLVNELGQVLIPAEYTTIEVPVDYEESFLFAAQTDQATDLYPLTGRKISTGKKYTAMYSESENVLTCEFKEKDKTCFHLFNMMDQYTQVPGIFKGTTDYARMIKIGSEWLLWRAAYFYESEKGKENAEGIDRSFFLFKNQDGKEYYEFDKRFKPIE